MANQVLGTDKIARLNDGTLLGMVTSIDWAPAFNAQDIYEMGRTTKLDTAMELEIGGSFDMETIGATAGILSRMKVTRDASGFFTGYLFAPGGANGKNGYTLTQDDMAEMQFDLLIHEKTDQVNFDRSVWLPRCFLTGFSGRADASGMATETFTFAGQDVVGLKKPYHDARSVFGTRNASTPAQIDLADATIDSTTYTLVYVYVDEKRFRTTNTDATYFTLGTGAGAGKVTMTTSEGTTLAQTQIFRVLVVKTTGSTTFPALVAGNRQTTAFYIKGYQANVFIAPASATSPTASEQWLKVQSCDYSVDLRVETLRQISQNLSGSSIYCRVPTFPLDCSLNASVYESDWADWAAVVDMSGEPAGVYQSSRDFAPKHLKGTFNVVISYYTKAGVKLQDIRFTDMRIEGYSTRASVGGRGEVTWSMKGTAFTIVGQNA